MNKKYILPSFEDKEAIYLHNTAVRDRYLLMHFVAIEIISWKVMQIINNKVGKDTSSS